MGENKTYLTTLEGEYIFEFYRSGNDIDIFASDHHKFIVGLEFIKNGDDYIFKKPQPIRLKEFFRINKVEFSIYNKLLDILDKNNVIVNDGDETRLTMACLLNLV
jgi:hypothetical protein